MDIQPSAPVNITLFNKVQEPKIVSAPDGANAVYHSLKLSDPIVAVQIFAKALLNETLKVFVQLNKKPTFTSYSWNYTLPKLGNDSNNENFTITDHLYTITIPASKINDVLNNNTNGSHNTTTESPTTTTSVPENSTIFSNGTNNGSEGNILYIGIKKGGK